MSAKVISGRSNRYMTTLECARIFQHGLLFILLLSMLPNECSSEEMIGVSQSIDLFEGDESAIGRNRLVALETNVEEIT